MFTNYICWKRLNIFQFNSTITISQGIEIKEHVKADNTWLFFEMVIVSL